MSEHIRIGLVSISDRASDGTYEDQGIPALKDWLGRALSSPWSAETRLIPDMLKAAAPNMKCTRQNSSSGGTFGAASLTSSM